MLKTKNIFIILIEPEVQGNIGAVARAMKNCDFYNLIICGTSYIDDDAFSRAKDGSEILKNAIYMKDFMEVRSSFDILVATSSIRSKSNEDPRRTPMDMKVLIKNHFPIDLKVGIIFGREGDGLRNSELQKCDFFVTIPASDEYPVYNMSQAALLLMHYIFTSDFSGYESPELASGKEVEMLIKKIMETAKASKFPMHKMDTTEVILRQIFSKASLTISEYYRLMGIFRKINLTLGREW
ncbi:RNA methyltransferase [Caldiplasma sukawensis]